MLRVVPRAAGAAELLRRGEPHLEAAVLGPGAAVAAKGETAKVPQDATVKASVGIGPRSEGGFGLDIALDVSLPGVPRERAQELVEKAHQVCPYSNATRNNIPVRLNVV